MSNFTDSIKLYFQGVRQEWGKITWPERRTVIVETFFVIGIITAFTIAVLLIDLCYKWLFGLIK